MTPQFACIWPSTAALSLAARWKLSSSGVPEQTKRIAQELLVGSKVDVLAGFGITPAALSVGPLITQAKTPAVIMAAATSGIVATSPYFVRTSYTLQQSAGTMAEWSNKNGIKRVVTMVSDYGPGIDAEKVFKERVEKAGGQIVGEIRVPMRNPDFSPFLQRVRDLNPQAVAFSSTICKSTPCFAASRNMARRAMSTARSHSAGPCAAVICTKVSSMGPALLSCR